MSGIKKTHQLFRAIVRQDDIDNGCQHWKNYEDAMYAARDARHALRAAFWYIENVGEDDPARTDIFFELRELMRGAL